MKHPKEKAGELIVKFICAGLQIPENKKAKYSTMVNRETKDRAKRCALICCDEIIKEIPMYTGNLNPNWKFWQAVKKELIK